MKKLHKLLAVGLACATAFSLAACGDDDKSPKGVNMPGPDPDSVKSEQVSEAQWKTAFDLSGYDNYTYQSLTEIKSSTLSDEGYRIVKFDGNKTYLKTYDYDSSSTSAIPPKVVTETYYSVDGSDKVQYTYDKDTDKWSKGQAKWFPNSEIIELYEITDMYSSFTYNEAQSEYVARDYDDGYFDSVTVKIVDGKVSVIVTVIDMGNGFKHTTTSQYYDFGTTSVTLPTVSGDSGSDSGSEGGDGTEGSESADLSSVNGVYDFYFVELDEDKNFIKGELYPGLAFELKDGACTAFGQSNYKLDGENIVFWGITSGTSPDDLEYGYITYEKIADGIYYNDLNEACIVRQGVTPPFTVVE